MTEPPKHDPHELSRTADFQIENFIPFQLAAASHILSRALTSIYSRHQLGIPEWQVLSTLGQAGPLTGKAIASRAHLHKTKVSRAIEVLRSRKLVSRARNERDLRESFISLSKLGRATYTDLVPLVMDFERRVFDAVEAADLEALKRVLRKLTEANIDSG